MAGPWEDYAQPSAAPMPWEEYGAGVGTSTATPIPAAPDQRNSALGMVDTFMRGAADTASFGLADEISAGLGTGFGLLGDYDAALKNERGTDKADTANRWWTRAGGQLVGGALSGGLLAPVLASAKFATSALGPRVLAGITDGTILGGLYGAGSGETPTDRAVQGAIGGGTGAVAGAAFPLAAAGAGKAYETIVNSLAAKPIAAQAGSDPATLRALGGILTSDGSLGAQGQANMARAGADGMLVDAGPTARSVLDTSIQRGGPGAVVARNRVDERTANGARALTGILDDTMGRPGESLSREVTVYGDKTNPMSLLYKQAYETPIDYSHPAAQRIEAAVKNRVPASAIRAANELMRVEGNQSKQILATIGDDGNAVFETLPDVRQLDYITRGLNEVAEQADGQGKLGGTTATGRAYANLSRELRGDLKEVVPAYKTAVDRAGTEIRKVKAEEFGSTLLSPSVTRDQVKEFVGDMGTAERLRLTQGIRSQIDDAMAQVTRTVADGDVPAREAVAALKKLSSRANREKLALAIGDGPAGTLFDEVDRVATSFDIRSSLSDNSRTYGRLAAQERVRDMSGQGTATSAAMRGEGLNAGKRIIQALTGETDAKLRGREDKVFSQLADLLTRQGGAGQGVYDAINLLGVTDQNTQRTMAQIAALLAGPKTSYPAAALAGNSLQPGGRR